MHDGPLDMRMNKEASLDAEYIVNHYKEEELADIIHRYGEGTLGEAYRTVYCGGAQRKAVDYYL